MTSGAAAENQPSALNGPMTVAVTGGIGAGKSTVSRLLEQHGAILVDSDQLSRDVVAPGTDGLHAVIDAFGTEILTTDGALDRAALAAVVFSNDDARATLEGIIHPLVRAEFERVRSAASSDMVVVNDIPLLRTTAEAAAFDLVVVVIADDHVRIRRLIDRGLGEVDARARIAAQITDAERQNLADVVLRNNAGMAELSVQVAQLWEEKIRLLQRTAPEAI